MAREMAERVFVRLNGRELQAIKSISIEPERDSQVHKTMRRLGEALAVTRGTPHWNLTLDVAPEFIPEINWKQLWRTGEEFETVVEWDSGGRREIYRRCSVTNVSDSAEDGTVTRSVTCVALGMTER